MQPFEYVVGLVSILLGLALTELASSLHKLLRARARVRWDWQAPAAAVALVLVVLDLWWGVRQLEQVGLTMTIGLFLPMLTALLLFYLAAAAALPDSGHQHCRVRGRVRCRGEGRSCMLRGCRGLL